MKIELYNARYVHVTNVPNVDFWWDNILGQVVPKATIQQLVLAKDSLTLSCGSVCVGSAINCCDDSLLANNLDCLFTNDYDCLTANA